MGEYRVILADPAWQYRVYDAGDAAHGAARSHYDTMPLDAIRRLPIAALAAPSCALLLWATMPCLPDALTVMQAWGFDFKTVAFTWIKLTQRGLPAVGLGHYTRGNAELCLLGTRGRPQRRARDVAQVIHTRRRQHSRKPDEQYPRIMRLFDGPYVEIFARQQWPGWDVWGNETTKYAAQPFLFDEQTI
jgi:N6-adenosine-specific RNA methylase IME4